MKTICIFLSLLVISAFHNEVTAQTVNPKDYKQYQQSLNSIKNMKVTKAAKQRAKELAKDGWKTDGSQTMEQQLDAASSKAEINRMNVEMGHPERFIIVQTEGEAKTKQQAKDMAMANSRTEAVRSIASDVATKIGESSTTMNFGDGDVQGYVSSINSNLQKAAGSISSPSPDYVFYKEMTKAGQTTYRVMVSVAYDRAKIYEAAKKEVMRELKEEGKNVEADLDNMFNSLFQK